MIITARPSRLNHKYSFADCVRKFKAAGFDGIEFCFEDYYFHARPDYAEDFFVKHAVDFCAEQGMTIASVGNHLEYVYDDAMYELVKKGVAKTRDYGADIFITASPDHPNHKIFHRDEYWAEYTKRLGVLLDIAAENGVRVAIEPEVNNLIVSTKDFLNLVDYMGRDNLVCNLDVGHAFLTDPDIYDSIRQLGKLIVHSHVEGMPRGEHMHLLPGEGDMDLPAVIKAMQGVGFDGALALDIYIQDYETVMAGCVKTLRTMI